MNVRVTRAGVGHATAVAPLFDSYRQFYGQRPDLPGATAFMTERLSRGESVVFLALDSEAALGFVQMYPSFSSVRIGTDRDGSRHGRGRRSAAFRPGDGRRKRLSGKAVDDF